MGVTYETPCIINFKNWCLDCINRIHINICNNDIIGICYVGISIIGIIISSILLVGVLPVFTGLLATIIIIDIYGITSLSR